MVYNPPDTNSNFAWQIGHILMAQNFHILACALGQNPKIIKELPLQDYAKVFRGLGSLERSVGIDFVAPGKLIEHFDLVHEQCLEGLDRTSDEILIESLNPIPLNILLQVINMKPYPGVLSTKCGTVLKWR